MQQPNAEDVYMTLCGVIERPFAVTGVEDAFFPGSACDILYNEVCHAYDRLRQRLNVQAEDPDVERIIGNLLSIQHILCEKMYQYGQKLPEQGKIRFVL